MCQECNAQRPFPLLIQQRRVRINVQYYSHQVLYFGTLTIRTCFVNFIIIIIFGSNVATRGYVDRKCKYV